MNPFDATNGSTPLMFTRTCQGAHSRAAVRLAYQDQQLDTVPAVRISCRPRPGECLTPGSVVRAEIRSVVDLPLMPAALGSQTPGIRVDSEHEAPYGTFREARP